MAATMIHAHAQVVPVTLNCSSSVWDVEKRKMFHVRPNGRPDDSSVMVSLSFIVYLVVFDW